MLQHGGLFDADTLGFSRLHAQAEELLQDPRVDTNAAFWGTVHRLVLLGQLDTAMTLLAHHPVAQAGQDEGMAGPVGTGIGTAGGLMRSRLGCRVCHGQPACFGCRLVQPCWDTLRRRCCKMMCLAGLWELCVGCVAA